MANDDQNRRTHNLVEGLIWTFVAIVVSGMLFLIFGPGHSMEPIRRSQARNLLAEIEAGLDFYKIENREYPIVHTGLPEEGGVILYRALITGVKDKKFPYLDVRPDIVGEFEGRKTLVDPWGVPVRYRREPAGIPAREKSTMNPTYDLWSTGGKPDNPRKKWIANFGL